MIAHKQFSLAVILHIETDTPDLQCKWHTKVKATDALNMLKYVVSRHSFIDEQMI